MVTFPEPSRSSPSGHAGTSRGNRQCRLRRQPDRPERPRDHAHAQVEGQLQLLAGESRRRRRSTRKSAAGPTSTGRPPRRGAAAARAQDCRPACASRACALSRWENISGGERKAVLGVHAGRRQQLIREVAAGQHFGRRVEGDPGILEQYMAHQRIAVGMQTGGSERDQHVALDHLVGPRARRRRWTTPTPVPETSYSSLSLDAGMLGGLATDECTACLHAAFGDTG